MKNTNIQKPVQLIHSTANPNGIAETELFLLTGDVTCGPINHIEANPNWNLDRSSVSKRTTPFRLRVLHFNDLHGFLSKLGRTGERSIFSRMVSFVKKTRQEYQTNPDMAVLFLTGGDEQVGSLFDELMGHSVESYQIHAGYHAYSAAGVDAGVVGNHDLDKGADLLAYAIEQDARFPLLSANILCRHKLKQLCYPAALFRIKGIRVGLIGLTTAGQLKHSKTNLTVSDPLTSLQNLLPAFKPYCDIIIILSHLGHSVASSMATVKPIGDVELARALDYCEVDLIVGGHTHHALNEHGLSQVNVVNGIPIVQAGTLGHYLGSVYITLRQETAAVSCVRLMTVSDLPVDEAFENTVVQPLLKQARTIFDTPLGVMSDDLGLKTVIVRNCFAVREVALVNFISDAIVSRCKHNGYAVDLAMVDAADVRSGLNVGPHVTLGRWLRIMPFADTIQLCQLTGRQLKDLLDDNARRIDIPGEPHVERGFLQLSRAIRYTVNIVGQQRCDFYASHITVNGVSLNRQLDKTFTLACSSFVRRACQTWKKYTDAKLNLAHTAFEFEQLPRSNIGLLVAQELITYIRSQGGITPTTGAVEDGRLQVTVNSQ